ncbi:c-type cytochrome [Aeromonas eucrenophila]|uniref:C-type cytochrome n=1 Tax=Aeromonas eucrenophila TaxID=649 RepID=A0ABW0YJ83_9GAMM|nr:cytochrome c [Aeromonas eucrenophila]
MMLSRLTFALLLGAGTVHGAEAQDPLVAQGAYLSKVGDCAACHTTEGGQKYAGGLGFETPFGVVYSTNISSDKTQGIGQYSYEQFREVMHNGDAPKGRLYPAMPYTSYHLVTDEDMKALYAYFMQTKPAATPNRDNGVSFPFNIRTGLLAWNLVEHDDSPFQPDPAKSSNWNRGRYLVDGLGHCGECHTPRNVFMGMDQANYLKGNMIEGVMAPEITATELRRQGWTHDSLTKLLRKGYSVKGSVFAGMYPVVEKSFAYLTDEDMHAVTSYLLDSDTPLPVPTPKPVTLDNAHPGYALYNSYCAGCHGQEGQGKPNVTPSMYTNATLDQKTPTNTLAVLLRGIPAQSYSQTERFAPMPSYAKELNEQQLADLVNFLRQTWAHQPSTLSADDIKALRQEIVGTHDE